MDMGESEGRCEASALWPGRRAGGRGGDRKEGEDDVDGEEEVCEEVKYRLNVPVGLEACCE